MKSKETVIITGTTSDQEVKARVDKIRKAGRKVIIEPRPSHDSGLCPCGKHQGSCSAPCTFPGDQGPTMGMGY